MSRFEKLEVSDYVERGINLSVKLFGSLCFGLDEQCREIAAGCIVYRPERFTVEKFACLHRSALTHCHYSTACFGHIIEVYHCRCGIRLLELGVESHFAYKRECAFAAHHTVCDDVERVVEKDERQYVETRNVLYGIFVLYELCQFRILAHFVADCLYFVEQGAVLVGERFARCFVGSVEHSAVGKNNANVAEYAVAVGVRSALHARCVICYNTANHSGFF